MPPMPATLPRIVPSTIAAGDTLQFTRPGGNYPPTDGWTLKYSLVGASGAYSFDATQDGEDYAINVDAATTKGWAAGTYAITEYVTNAAGERHTLGSQPAVITADLAAATGASDTRTHAQRMLDTIQTYLETKDPGAADVMINGRRISYYTVPDLLLLRDRYKADVLAENRRASGRAPRILARL